MDKIQRSIDKFGSKPEHNAYDCIYNRPKNSKNVIFDFGDDKLMLASYNKNLDKWYLYQSDILCPEDSCLSELLQFSRYCLKEERHSKIVMEIEDELFDKLKLELVNNNSRGLKILRVNNSYYWPIIDLRLWNDDLSGKKWHKTRNMVRNIYKGNNIEILSSSKVDKELLKGVVYSWKSNRKGKDRADYKHYLNLIENNFSGTDYTSSILVNGEPCSISGGWKIPNTSSFYLSIMLHNYKIKGMGEFMYIESLRYLKKIGVDMVNLGGSEKKLLAFKEKFSPHYIYKTYEFLLVNQ